MPLLDTTLHKDLLGTFISDLVLQIMSYTAQTECELIRRRQAEGIAAARVAGKTFGKNPIPLPPDFHDIFHRWRRGDISALSAAKLCGFSRRTLYQKTEALRGAEKNFRMGNVVR
jgi:DNA invertase Pin-like site-specific DNA recombinase